MKYITKIKSNLSIFTKKRTSNILEGTYSSIYKGKSMNFEDLREYVIGDNVKDIDWKASARANKILIKQYIAEKKHNVLFVLDTGKKMMADTKKFEAKSEVALMTMGIIAYLVEKNGDNISAIYKSKEKIQLFPFKTGLYNIEKILNFYEKNIGNEGKLPELISYVLKTINRKMIIFIITDIEGMNSVSEELLKRISINHEVMFINISDALMTGKNAFDVEQENYIPEFFLKDSKLNELELEVKQELYNDVKKKFNKYRIVTTTINQQDEIVQDVYKLLERQRYANNH